MAKVSPEDPYPGSRRCRSAGQDHRDLDLYDPTEVSADSLRDAALAAEEAALAVPGVTNSGGSGASAGLGGMVLATSHGFVGHYVGSRFARSASVIAGEGTGMERDYEYSSRLHFADLDAPDEIGRKAGERAVRRLNARKAADRAGRRRLRSARRARHRRPSRRRHQRRVGGAQDELPARHDGQAGGVRGNHRHRRAADGARPGVAALRRRGRRRRRS